MIRAVSAIAIAIAIAIALAACSPQAETKPDVLTPEAPAPVQPSAAATTLDALEQAHEWQRTPGATLNAAWNEGVKAVLGKLSRPDAIKAITDAKFECIYGEAHQDYPDPMAVCTRSFATRACQMDWEISSTAKNGMVDDVDGSFKRDCVGTEDDWPEPIKSAIDDQVAPATPPARPN